MSYDFSFSTAQNGLNETYIDDNPFNQNKNIIKYDDVEQKLNKKYQIDQRILYIEKESEEKYQQQKQMEDRIAKEREREKALNELYLAKQYNEDSKNKYKQYEYESQQIIDQKFKNQNDQYSNIILQPLSVSKNFPTTVQQFIEEPQQQQQSQQQQTYLKYQNQNNWESDTIPDNDQYQETHQSQQEDYKQPIYNQKPQIVNNKVNIVVPNILNGDFNLQDNLSKFKNNSNVHREFVQQNDKQELEKIKKQKKHCNACETRFIKYENQNKFNQFQGIDINRTLLDARILLNKNSFNEAETILESIVQKKIDHSDVYYMLGETKRLLGKLKEAEFNLLQALQFEVHSPYVFNSLALVYMQLGGTKRAILLLKKFVEQIADAKAFFNLGRCLVKEQNHLEAAVHFTKAIEMNSAEPFYYLHRADTYEAIGYTELATSDYKKFKELKPDYIQKLQQQAMQLSKQQQKEETVNIINYIKKLSLY